MLTMLLAAGCGSQRNLTREGLPPGEREWKLVTPSDPEGARSVLMRAFSLVGTPYRWGGNTPQEGFDCSGLVNFVYRDMLAMKLPRTSRELAEWQGPKVRAEKLAAADLVFFSEQGQVFHVGIYVGEGRFIHAPRTGKNVRLDRLDGPFWRDRYSGARRVLR